MKRMVICLALFLIMAAGAFSAQAAGAPNLVPISVVLSNEDYGMVHVLRTEAGKAYGYSATIRNAGIGSAPAFKVLVLVSDTPSFSSKSAVVGQKNLVELGAGKSIDISGTISLSGKAGPYYVGLWIDPGNAVRETNELDNFSRTWASMAMVLLGEDFASADPFRRLKEWQKGIVSPELWDGKAEHDYSPAAYIVFAAKENHFNLVSLLVLLEISQHLVAKAQSWNADLDYQMLIAMSYGIQQWDRCRWLGFVPQLVGTSYQFWLYETRDNLDFERAFMKFTNNQGTWQDFHEFYYHFAWLLSIYLEQENNLEPDSDGYYLDFQVTPENQKKMIAAVQKFLAAMGSPLKNESLFRQKGRPSMVDYDRIGSFCQ